MSETSPEESRPHGGPARIVALALVVAGAAWVGTSLREDPGQASPVEDSPVSVPTPSPRAAMEVALAEVPDARTGTSADAHAPEGVSPAPEPSPPDPEELERRTAMARRAASLQQDPVQVLVADAQRLLNEGRHDEAIRRARQAMHERKSPAAYAVETRALCAKGDAEGARRAFSRVLGSEREPTIAACTERGIQLAATPR